MKIRQKAENLLGWIGQSSAQNPWHYIAFSFLLLAASVWQLQYLVINTTTEGFLQKDDPAIVTFEAFKNEFGRDVQFIVSVQSDDVFSPGFIKEFIRLHKALAEQVPYVDDVSSLYNVRDIYGEDGELIVQGFLDELPEDDAGWAARKKKALQHPLYRNIYISADGKMVNIYVRPDVSYAAKEGAVNKAGFAMMRKMLNLYAGIGSEPDDTQAVQAGNVSSQSLHYEPLGELQIHDMIVSIRHVLTQFPALEKDIHIAGTPVLTDELSYYLVQDMLKFIAMAMMVIAAVLYVLYRSLWGVVLPLIVVVTALVTTMGLMSITGQSVQSPTVILPSFVMAVGISDTIHLVNIWIMKMRAGESKPLALQHALMHTGVPIFFTTMTTVAGLLSFGSSDIVPIANLGYFSAAGVFFAFVYTIILLPALIVITPVDIKPETARSKVNMVDRFITFSVWFSKKHATGIVVASFMTVIVSLYGASQLRFSHDPIQWLPETSYGRQAIEIVSKRIGGTVPVEIVIDTGEQDGVKDAVFMRLLDEAAVSLETYKTERLAVGKVLAVNTLLKETNKALYDNAGSAYVIPDSRELIAQEFLMLETSGAEDVFKMVDSHYQKARITVLTPWVDALYFGDYIRGMETMLKDKFGDGAEVQITGIVPMLSKTLKKIMYSTAQSYIFAFVVITFMMILLLGSVRYGLVSILPNVMPVTMALALMHVLGAPLDMFSMLIGSIAMGLAVDDTVHFMDSFQNIYKRTGDVDRAIAETLHTSGRAMVSTSVVLTLGFLIYLFSPMHNLKDFGMYTALCIVIALLADFWMTPALLRLMHREK